MTDTTAFIPPEIRQAGVSIANDANNDLENSMGFAATLCSPFEISGSYSESSWTIPPSLKDPIDQFASAFLTTYQALLTQREAMGHALQGTATSVEDADLQIAQGFHLDKYGLMPIEDTPDVPRDYSNGAQY